MTGETSAPVTATRAGRRRSDPRRDLAVTPSAKVKRPVSARTDRLVAAGLLLLTVVPVSAGMARLAELLGGAVVTPGNARFFASPVPVTVHIISVTLYSVLGAFQFLPGLRRRNPRRHRVVGRLLVPSGLAAALSGLWMTVFYPRPATTGDLLSGLRLVFGSAMIVSIVLGFAAIRRRDIARHRAWMIRGYAIGLGAGTQVFTQGSWILLVGPLGKPSSALTMGAGWLINLAFAEWLIRRHRPSRSVASPAGGASSRSVASSGGGRPSRSVASSGGGRPSRSVPPPRTPSPPYADA
ncbi:DUF2306 domain-containing protein [Actinoallomurus acanthiterrae]